MRPKVVAVILVMLLMMTVVGPAAAAAPVDVVRSPFTDVADDAAGAQAFALLHAAGIFEGYVDGSVGPENTLTRAEFAKVAVAAMNRGTTATALSSIIPSFSDSTAIPNWAWGWVNAAHSMGIVQGRTDNLFDPAAPVTYAEALTMMVRALGYEPTVVGTWPAGHIAKAADLGLTEGVTLAFDAPITREAMASLTHNALFTPLADAKGGWIPGKSGMIYERFDYAVDDTFTVADYSFGPRVALFGASDVVGIEGLEVERLRRNNRLVYIEASSEKITGVWTRYSTISQRITVDDQVYSLAQEAGDLAVELVINQQSRFFNKGGNEVGLRIRIYTLEDHFLNELKDQPVMLSLNADGEVFRIEATLNTFENSFLARAEVESDEDTFGVINIRRSGPGQIRLFRAEPGESDLEVNDETRIWLDGDRVTRSDLESALEEFQTQWTSTRFDEARPVVTARTFGNQTREGVVLDVWVWTENRLTGEISSRGYSVDLSHFVRVGGEVFVIDEALLDDIDFGGERIFLLDSEDRIVDILNAPTRAAMSFAILLEYSNVEIKEVGIKGYDSGPIQSPATADVVVQWGDGREEDLRVSVYLPTSDIGLISLEEQTHYLLQQMLGLPVVMSENWSVTTIINEESIETLEHSGIWLYRLVDVAWLYYDLRHDVRDIVDVSVLLGFFAGEYSNSTPTWIR